MEALFEGVFRIDEVRQLYEQRPLFLDHLRPQVIQLFLQLFVLLLQFVDFLLQLEYQVSVVLQLLRLLYDFLVFRHYFLLVPCMVRVDGGELVLQSLHLSLQLLILPFFLLQIPPQLLVQQLHLDVVVPQLVLFYSGMRLINDLLVALLVLFLQLSDLHHQALDQRLQAILHRSSFLDQFLDKLLLHVRHLIVDDLQLVSEVLLLTLQLLNFLL